MTDFPRQPDFPPSSPDYTPTFYTQADGPATRQPVDQVDPESPQVEAPEFVRPQRTGRVALTNIVDSVDPASRSVGAEAVQSQPATESVDIVDAEPSQSQPGKPEEDHDDQGDNTVKPSSGNDLVSPSDKPPSTPRPSDPEEEPNEPQSQEANASTDGTEEAEPIPSSGAGDGNTVDPPTNPPPGTPTAPCPDDEPNEPERIARHVLVPLRETRAVVLQDAADYAHETAQDEQDAPQTGLQRWGAFDSPLEGPDEESFATWFEGDQPVVPEGQTLKEHIETTLAPQQHRRAIEIGGLGSTLFRGFSDGFFEATCGVTLSDSRLTYQPPNDEIAMRDDVARNHRVLTGDIMQPEAMRKIDDWLDGDKASLIISRMYQGVHVLPKDPFALGNVATALYERLADNGLLIAQVPPAFPRSEVNRWKQTVEATIPGLEVQVGQYISHTYTTVRIQKLDGAPETLPLIPARHYMEERHNLRRMLS